jgi:hypothetical protein
MLLESATVRPYGPANRAHVDAMILAESSISRAQSSAQTGKSPMAAKARCTTTNTNALAVETHPMEPKDALALRRLRVLTPLKPEAWDSLLRRYNLSSKYPNIPNSICFGFDTGIVPIVRTYTPLNHAPICKLLHVFKEIVDHEFNQGCYIGPFSLLETESLIGPFQTSPLALVDKPGKPNQYRLIQNLSHPHNWTRSLQSINHSLNSDLYPCTWGTFTTFSLLVYRLSLGTQGACRDVAEAYQTIPLAPSQWPGMGVRLSDNDQFAINTNNCFGLATAGGIYGIIGDTNVDIL